MTFHQFRRSRLLSITAYSLLLFISEWNIHIVTVITNQFMLTVPDASPAAVWIGINGQFVFPIATSPLIGLLINVFSARSVIAVMSLLCGVLAVLYAQSTSVVAVLMAQTAFGVYTGLVFIAAQAYVTTTTSVLTRTRFFVGMYFTVNVVTRIVVNVVLQTSGQPSAQQAGFVMMACQLTLLVLMVLIVEPPMIVPDRKKTQQLSLAYWHSRKAHDAGDSCGDALQATCSVFARTRDLSWMSLIGCALMISSTIVGFDTFSTRVDTLVDNYNVFTPAQKAEFVFGIYGGIALAALIMLYVIRWIADRALLILFAITMAAGYLTALNYGTPMSGARFVVADAIITFSENFVLAIATSLVSKLVPGNVCGLWFGLLEGWTYIAKTTSALLIGNSATDILYYVTLAILALSLCLLIPFFKDTIPVLHSPWSGAGLPSSIEHGRNDSMSEPFGSGGGSRRMFYTGDDSYGTLAIDQSARDTVDAYQSLD